MALDTKQKRGSVLDLTLPWREWLADPDSSLSVADRQALLKLGSGVFPATGDASGSGSVAPITLSPPAGTGTGSAAASGSIAAVTLAPPTGTAVGTGGDATGTGSVAPVALTAPTGTGAGSAAASGSVASITLVAPTGVATGAAATVGRPSSDTSNTGWLPSTGSALYPMIDEVVPDSADYIYATSVGAVCEMALNATTYPGTATQVLKFRGSSSTGHGVSVKLKNTGGATVRTQVQALTATDTEYSITLTSGEIAAITSGALTVELESV